MTELDFVVPVRTGRGLNDRLHWAVRAGKVKRERAAVSLSWPRASGVKVRPSLPVDVHLVRLSPATRRMDDDGVQGALKAVRDQVAAELGADDGDRTRLRFTYGQERGPWGVRVSIRGRKP